MHFNYFDIHSHLNLSSLSENTDEVIKKMEEKEIGTITVGTDFETSKKAVELAEKHDFLWATVGLHPNDNISEIFDYEKYKELAQNNKVVAIGETGLDYFRTVDAELQKRQKEIFIKHIELALEINKPLMIHSRPSKGSMDAYEDVIEIVKNYPGVRANFHFFVGNIEIAKKALESGFTMSFDGPITFSRDYDDVIRFLPIESIMAETDAPFAAPAPYRGKTCEPWMVEEVVKRIAEIKQLPLEEVSTAMVENAKKFFNV